MAESSEKQLNSNGNSRGMHPNSRKNLTKANGWKPGQSGNPKGRPPKDMSITSLVKEMLDEEADERWLHPSDYGRHMTWRQAIAKALLVGAVKGQPVALKELLDRLEGKPVQPIGGAGEPILLKVVYDDST